ncbi:MAG: hypothetical protein HY363_01435 [Candidatus Aenigmarchaeota archaeon]|nr:hypothetical protein [Candidatus Aenigmarchaeota archaeon]
MDTIETAIQNFKSKGFATKDVAKNPIEFCKRFKQGSPVMEEYAMTGWFYPTTKEYELWLYMKHGYNDAVETFETDLRHHLEGPDLDEQVDKAIKEVKKNHNIPEEVSLEICCEYTLSGIIEIKGTNFDNAYAKLQTTAKKFGHEI